MSRLVAAGARVRVGAPGSRPHRLGDVVLVRLPTALRLHRLVWGPPLTPWGARWRTQGDRSCLWDPLLDPRHILRTVPPLGSRPAPGGRALGTSSRTPLASCRVGDRPRPPG